MAQTAGKIIDPSPPTADSVRDTIDSIVVALILAFVFRAFMVEAFRIPTGSMAPTLYGEHCYVRCEDCGYSYVFNMAVPFDYRLIQTTCPNCDQRNETDGRTAPIVANGGDRILVLKLPYDIGGDLLGPHRWDVTVFKDPKDSQTNFIKRLIGLPNEVLEIIDGDIYTVPASKVPAGIIEKLEAEFPQRLTPAERKQLNGLLKIQRKTRVAQSSLWLNHYNHDYAPHNRNPDQPYWAPVDNESWSTDEPRLVCDGKTEENTALIKLGGKAIRDNYGYNFGIDTTYRSVPDVRVQCVLVPRADTGAFDVRLTRDDYEFRARIDAEKQTVSLFIIRPDRPGYEDLIGETRDFAIAADHPIEVAFQQVDYRVSLELDGKEILATNDKQYAPDLDKMTLPLAKPFPLNRSRATVSLGSHGMPLELSHLHVKRDVFYRDLVADGHLGRGDLNNWTVEYPDVGRGTWSYPILLRDTDYYACGDNSPQSADSRMWHSQQVSAYLKLRSDQDPIYPYYQVGTVPADQLIGRAFLVYWPAGHRLFSSRSLSIVPNFGRMRIIR